MMKRAVMICGAMALLFVAGFFSYKHLDPQVIRPEADYHIYSLDEMEQLATAIVEVEYEREKSSVVRLDEKDKYPLETKTFSEVKVQNVYKGNVNIGDTLTIVEYYAKWRDLYGSYQWMPNEIYVPLSKGKTYLLFLYQGPTQQPDTYEIIGNHQGKYVIPAAKPAPGLTVAELEIDEDDEAYRQLYKQVSEKYGFGE